MAKQNICKKCGSENYAGIKFCSNCGAKLKKPVYKRWWFWVLIVIAVIAAKTSFDNYNDTKLDWDGDVVLSDVIPNPNSKRGEIHSNSTDSLRIDIMKFSPKDYSKYVDSCRNKGFTIDEDSSSNRFSAYNKDGYKLSLSYYETKEEMSLTLDAPEKMDVISWPESGLAALLPTPNSTVGKINWDRDTGFCINIGNTTKTEFTSYVDACSKSGFTVDYERENGYYRAYNDEGYYLSLSYEGGNVMRIEIKAPEEASTSVISDPEESEEPVRTSPDPDSNAISTDQIRPEFKKMMDSYEAFFDEYVELMKAIQESPSDTQLLVKYADYMSKYADMIEKLEAVETTEDMNAAELSYYIEVNARIQQKLLSVYY